MKRIQNSDGYSPELQYYTLEDTIDVSNNRDQNIMANSSSKYTKSAYFMAFMY